MDGDLAGDACDDDIDGDDYPNEQDCNPYDGEVFPGADEQCNGMDDNCNGAIDEGFLDTNTDGEADCVDEDDDGDGDTDDTDCAPLDPTIHTGAEEVCDGLDNNCNGSADEGCPAAGVRFEQLMGIVRGESGGRRAEVFFGRPVGLILTDEDMGYKLQLGHTH